MAGRRVILSHVTHMQAQIDSSRRFLVVRYDFVRTQEEYAKFKAGEPVEEQAFGFPMTAPACRKLAELMTRKADELEHGGPPN